MARYFFDVINGIGLVEDEEGQDLPGLSAAREVAIAGVRSILREDVAAGFIDLAGRIDVRDADRQPLVSIPFRDAVELRGLDAEQTAP
jgi:hypothetical protein